MKQKGLISSSNPNGVRPPIAPKPAKKLAKWDEIVCLLPKELKEGEMHLLLFCVIHPHNNIHNSK